MSPNVPEGERFSHVYVQRGDPAGDSIRMRHRVGSLIFEDDFKTLQERLGTAIDRKIGINVPHHRLDWPDFFKEIALNDFLDVITVAFRILADYPYAGPRTAHKWLVGVQEIFAEEHVHYRLDAKGGVHFHFDGEFARNRAATIASLQDPRYANASDAFEEGMRALAKAPPDGKSAIRSVFAAAEGLFRLMVPDALRLTGKELDRLQPILQRQLAGDAAARGAAMKLLGAFKDWTDAAHFYRHEQGVEEVAQPPLVVAVQVTSIGATFLRWLAELDASLRG